MMAFYDPRKWLTHLGVWTANPLAFGVLGVFTLSWIIFEPETFDWHGATTVVTLVMTLFIQRAAHRDTQALHLKMDELLKADEGARTHLKSVDDKEPEEIEQLRERERDG